MDIIIQPKRILIREFLDDRSLSYFHKYCTIQDIGMYFEVTKEWVAAFETSYNGVPYLAVPRRFNMDLIERNAVTDEIVRDNHFIPHVTREITSTVEARSVEQQTMLDFVLGENKYAKINKQPRRALFADTGSGKTFMTLKSIAERQDFAFINCPDNKAIVTWKEEIAKFTDITPEEIGIVRGADSIPRLLKNKEKYKIILSSSKTFSSLILKNKTDVIEEFFNEMGFSLIVHDEVHLNIIVVFFIEMIASSRRTLYLTATPGRRIYKESKLLDSLMPNESCVFYEEIKPRFELVQCSYYSNPQLPAHVKGLNKPRGFDYINYGKYLLNAKYPYREPYLDTCITKVVKAARKLLTNPDNKIAILGKTKEENNIMYDYLSNSEEFKGLTVGLFNSDIENIDERFKQTEAQLIVSTDKSFAGIINIPKLEAIILMHPTTSDEHFIQICGRIRREEGKRSLIFTMADFSFKRCKRASSQMKSILGERLISSRSYQLTKNPSSSSIEFE